MSVQDDLQTTVSKQKEQIEQLKQENENLRMLFGAECSKVEALSKQIEIENKPLGFDFGTLNFTKISMVQTLVLQ